LKCVEPEEQSKQRKKGRRVVQSFSLFLACQHMQLGGRLALGPPSIRRLPLGGPGCVCSATAVSTTTSSARPTLRITTVGPGGGSFHQMAAACGALSELKASSEEVTAWSLMQCGVDSSGLTPGCWYTGVCFYRYSRELDELCLLLVREVRRKESGVRQHWTFPGASMRKSRRQSSSWS
jgi:hypothetical protein